ncbi:MAG: UDP-3-O-[3-hydroxymyristoyl] glucosamine N-acyltransferase [Myxococcota bacterium]|jgi:UDP-3-O-[3-hydroxymyristoyl] glucosamine N-acyltransferase
MQIHTVVILALLTPAAALAQNISSGAVVEPTAIIDATATVETGAYVGSYAVVGADVTISEDSYVAAYAHIDGALGTTTVLGVNTIIGRRATVGAGTVLGDWSVVGRSATVGIGASFPNRLELSYAAVIGDYVRVTGTASIGALSALGGAAPGPGFAVDCAADLVIARGSSIAATSPFTLTCAPDAVIVVGPNSDVGADTHIGGDLRIRKGSVIGDGLQTTGDVRIGRGAMIADGVTMSDGVVLSAGVTVGAGVTIAPNTRLQRGHVEPAVDSFGCDGSGLCPSTNITLCGSQSIDGLHIPEGVVVTCTPGCTTPLDLTVTGSVLIEGTLDLTGNAGARWNASSGTPARAQGGTGTCGGFSGGQSGSYTSAGSNGAGPRPGGRGGTQSSGQYINGGEGGGGGFATSGFAGFNANPGSGGGTIGSAAFTTLDGGSGGGGGGGGLGGASTRYSGGGGGAGAGALRISTTGNITIGATGSIIADGGLGGSRQDVGAAGGGGAGSGGSIWLVASSIVNDGTVSALGGRNLYSNGASATDGGGGEGRIRLDTEGAVTPSGSFLPAVGYTGTN